MAASGKRGEIMLLLVVVVLLLLSFMIFLNRLRLATPHRQLPVLEAKYNP